MALSATVTDHWTDGKRIHVIGKLISSGTYPTGGDTVSFAALMQIKANSVNPPTFVEIRGQGILSYNFIYGTNMANGKVFAVTAGAQLAAGAYPTDTITYHAIFHKYV